MRLLLSFVEDPASDSGLLVHCFAEDHQLMTNRGFMYLDELEVALANDAGLLVAGFDPATQQFVYERPIELVVNTTQQQQLVTFADRAESLRWQEGADAYGRSAAEVARSEGRMEERAEDVSSGVSLAVTSGHDMYVRQGKRVGGRKAGTRSSVEWTATRKRTADGSRKRVFADFAKVQAGELVGLDTNRAIKFLGRAASGVRGCDDILPTDVAAALGIQNTLENAVAFCELLGYFLGDGTLQFKCVTGGRDTVAFSPVKPRDRAYLFERFALLGLTRDVDFHYYEVCDPVRFLIGIYRPGWFNLFADEYAAKYHVPPESSAYKEKGDSQVAEELRIKSAKWLMHWVWLLAPSLARAIIAGLRFADGSEAGDFPLIYTSSVRFRDELVRLMLHAGYSPNIRVKYLAGESRGTDPYSGNDIVAQNDSWMVSYAENDQTANPTLNAAEVGRVAYNGRTWCVRMPSGFVVVRRAASNAAGSVIKATRPTIQGNCISGWDRTPLFVSLLRISLWADGEVHQSLSAAELLYLTIAYDWLLFNHFLNDRKRKGEDIFDFCFYLLRFIEGGEFSLKNPDSFEPVIPQHSSHCRRRRRSSSGADRHAKKEAESLAALTKGSSWQMVPDFGSLPRRDSLNFFVGEEGIPHVPSSDYIDAGSPATLHSCFSGCQCCTDDNGASLFSPSHPSHVSPLLPPPEGCDACDMDDVPVSMQGRLLRRRRKLREIRRLFMDVHEQTFARKQVSTPGSGGAVLNWILGK